MEDKTTKGRPCINVWRDVSVQRPLASNAQSKESVESKSHGLKGLTNTGQVQQRNQGGGSERLLIPRSIEPVVPKAGSVWICPVTGMEFLFIPGGKFMMGSDDGYIDEKPVHEVELDGFWLGKFPVTQGEWVKIMGSNPSDFKLGDHHPVENVSWDDAMKFIKKLNAKVDGKYRLPTEAEWEYGCQAGSKDSWCFGNDESVLEDFAWYEENSGDKTHPVGEKKPNDWGLHDMLGNVWEWVTDWYEDNFYAKSPKRNPLGPSSGSCRVSRGGGWFYHPSIIRSADRIGFDPGFRGNDLGFRLARTNH